MSNTKPYITRELATSTKYYCESWMKISKFFMLFPLTVELIKAVTIRDGLSAIAIYPVRIISLGMLGGLYGFITGVKKHDEEVVPNLDNYTIDTVKIITTDLCSYVEYNVEKIFTPPKYTKK